MFLPEITRPIKDTIIEIQFLRNASDCSNFKYMFIVLSAIKSSKTSYLALKSAKICNFAKHSKINKYLASGFVISKDQNHLWK